MSEWQETELGNIAKIKGGKRLPKGKSLVETPTNHPYIRTRDINNNKIAINELLFVPDDVFPSISRYIVEERDVIISIVGTIGLCSIIPRELHLASLSENCAKIVEIDEIVLDSQFLFYYLISDVGQAEFEFRTVGSTQPKLPLYNIRTLPIPLPPLPEQRAIAGVLSSLDDKIDLLHRQNETLEALAQTLFRQWFVEEADDDWDEKKLKKVCEIKNGYAFKSSTYQDSGYRIIRTVNFENHLLNLEGLTFVSPKHAEDFRKFNLKRFDYLLVMVGANLGNFAIVTKDVLPALQNQNMWCFRARKGISQHYLNFAMKDIVSENLYSASGSARRFFQKRVFYELNIIIPPKHLMQDFHETTENIYSKIEHNQVQIRTLEKLRDTLLPKLMSGVVQV